MEKSKKILKEIFCESYHDAQRRKSLSSIQIYGAVVHRALPLVVGVHVLQLGKVCNFVLSIAILRGVLRDGKISDDKGQISHRVVEIEIDGGVTELLTFRVPFAKTLRVHKSLLPLCF